MEERMINYKAWLQGLYDRGVSLREISRASYELREKMMQEGKEWYYIPYMAITDKQKKAGVIRIEAMPTGKQWEMKTFFDQVAEGSTMQKYRLYIDRQEGVVFKKKLGKGKDNFILL